MSFIICPKCGSEMVKENIVNPSCTQKGYTLYKCSCGYETKTDYKIYTSHNYIEIQRKEPNCSEDGFIKEKCVVCGHENFKVLQKNGMHVFGEQVIKQEQTCIQRSISERKCKLCGFIEIKEGPEPSHKFSNWVENPRECCTDATTKFRICEICGETETEEVRGKSHSFTRWETNPLNNEEEIRICTICSFEQIVPNKVRSDYKLGFDDLGRIHAESYCGNEREIIIPNCITELYRLFMVECDDRYIGRKDPFDCSKIESITTNKLEYLNVNFVENLYVDSKLKVLVGSVDNLYFDSLNHFYLVFQNRPWSEFKFNNLYVNNDIVSEIHFTTNDDFWFPVLPNSIKRVYFENGIKIIHVQLVNFKNLEVYVNKIDYENLTGSVSYAHTENISFYFNNMDEMCKFLNLSMSMVWAENVSIYLNESRSNECKKWLFNWIESEKGPSVGVITLYCNNSVLIKIKLKSYRDKKFRKNSKWDVLFER